MTNIEHQSASSSNSDSENDSRSPQSTVASRIRKLKRSAVEKADVEQAKRMNLLTNFLTKEKTEIEIWCSSLACTLKKMPEYVQAELKLSISNIVGKKEIEFLKGRATTPNHYFENVDTNSVPLTEME